MKTYIAVLVLILAIVLVTASVALASGEFSVHGAYVENPGKGKDNANCNVIDNDTGEILIEGQGSFVMTPSGKAKLTCHQVDAELLFAFIPPAKRMLYLRHRERSISFVSICSNVFTYGHANGSNRLCSNLLGW